MDQIDSNIHYDDKITKKFVVKTCHNQGNLLIFPDNFPVGKKSREFLLQNSTSNCYVTNNSYEEFM